MEESVRKIKTYNFGEIAYNGYLQKSNNKSLISGQDLPPWEDLSPEIQAAWMNSGFSVARFIEGVISGWIYYELRGQSNE